MRTAMKLNRKSRYLATAVSLWFILFFIFSYLAFADATITVRPHIGGSELDFGQVSPDIPEVNKEVDVEIGATTGQYELRQEPLTPLHNGRGDEIAWNNFSVRGLIGSNKFGRLEIQPHSLTQDILYTANQSGAADSFILVYTFNAPLEVKPDFYRGQIRFTLLPVSAGQSSVSRILNVIVNIKEGLEQKPSLEITIPSGLSRIYLNSGKDETKRAEIRVSLNAKSKKPFTIRQTLLKPLESSEGNILNSAAVNLETKSVERGSGLALTALSDVPQILYSSKPTGEADDSFIISYSLSEGAQPRAGRYRSRLLYSLEEMGIERVRKIVELEIENEQFFDLLISPQDISGIIEFRDLKPGPEDRKSEVIIEVHTNIGKRYQVNQNVFSALVNQQGETIPLENLTVRTEGLNTHGRLALSEKQKVKIGDTVLFISDNNGSTDKFKVIYELKGSEDIQAGDYSTRISYSLLEI